MPTSRLYPQNGWNFQGKISAKEKNFPSPPYINKAFDNFEANPENHHSPTKTVALLSKLGEIEYPQLLNRIKTSCYDRMVKNLNLFMTKPILTKNNLDEKIVYMLETAIISSYLFLDHWEWVKKGKNSRPFLFLFDVLNRGKCG